MLKYPCLILDHDDTVVQSEATINYPFFCKILAEYRPGETITLDEYTQGCFSPGFAGMCRDRFHFTEQELFDEFQAWLSHVRTHMPPIYPGIDAVIRKQKDAGGLLCVVSHSSTENIIRDYRAHFGILPDAIYSWDLPEALRKPSTYPLEDIMARYQLKPRELLMVDDMKPGYDMASRAGVPIAFAGWGRKNSFEICRQMERCCDFVFYAAEDLERFLFSA